MAQRSGPGEGSPCSLVQMLLNQRCFRRSCPQSASGTAHRTSGRKPFVLRGSPSPSPVDARHFEPDITFEAVKGKNATYDINLRYVTLRVSRLRKLRLQSMPTAPDPVPVLGGGALPRAAGLSCQQSVVFHFSLAEFPCRRRAWKTSPALQSASPE
jgi:hypothetical protein